MRMIPSISFLASLVEAAILVAEVGVESGVARTWMFGSVYLYETFIMDVRWSSLWKNNRYVKIAKAQAQKMDR